MPLSSIHQGGLGNVEKENRCPRSIRVYLLWQHCPRGAKLEQQHDYGIEYQHGEYEHEQKAGTPVAPPHAPSSPPGSCCKQKHQQPITEYVSGNQKKATTLSRSRAFFAYPFAPRSVSSASRFKFSSCRRIMIKSPQGSTVCISVP